MFTVLVGHPGIGKGEAMNPALQVVRKANSANIMSDRITIEWIKQELSKGFPAMGVSPLGGITIGGIEASCLLVAPELSVFLRFPEDELPDLADLWDSRPEPQMYGTRSKGLVTITAPCPSMLAGCAPAWLKDAIPPSAIGGGFSRRVNFVFAEKSKSANPWPDPTDWNSLLTPLVDDLKYMGSHLHGQYRFDTDARPIFEKIFAEKDNVLDDEATSYYHQSRWTNASKLAMCLAAARRDDLVITKTDMEEADDMTADVRDGLKSVFRGVGSSDLIEATDKVMIFLDNTGAASREQIQAAVWRYCSRNELDMVLLTLRDAMMITEVSINKKTLFKAVPQAIVNKRFNAKRNKSAYGHP